MSGFKINTGNGQSVRITQSVSDVKAGIRQNDLSRISAYSGGKGVHTGARSSTVGRHNQQFGKNR